jgi:hypothetical protein
VFTLDGSSKDEGQIVEDITISVGQHAAHDLFAPVMQKT